MSTKIDDYYDVYAWDVVDIFFATVVASLPALNGLVDDAVKFVKRWGSLSNKSLLGKIRSLSHTSSRDHRTELSKKDSEQSMSTLKEPPKVSWSSEDFDRPIIHAPADIELQDPAYNEWHRYNSESKVG